MRSLCLLILLIAFFSGIVVAPESAHAGWRWGKKDASGLKKYSPEWWDYTGSLPVGSRQVYRHGKMWPNRPRPTDPQQTFAQQYHSAHFWPHPYNAHDRSIVKVFGAAQINQGWKNATTLYNYHFNPETHELTRSGREHVLWVIQSVPQQHQALRVQLSTEPHINSVHVSSVNAYLGEISSVTGRTLPVNLALTSPVTRPAVEVELYQKAWNDGLILPHIPFSTEGGDSGGE